MNAKTIGIFVLLVGLCLFLSLQVPELFLKGNNIENLLRRTAMYGVLGIGVAFVIITSGIDLSIGSMVCLVGCLLAIFLRVDYLPFDGVAVLRVEAANRKIVLPGNVATFEPGMDIRYFGGRRARNAILKIEDVSNARDEESARPTTVLSVDQPLSRNDTTGVVARLFRVSDFMSPDAVDGSAPTRPRVTLAGDHSQLRSRDRISFVHLESGQKDHTVISASSGPRETTITLDESLGAFDANWMAILLERRQRMSIASALLLIAVIALALGWLHGILVTQLRLQPFVVTLCGLLFYRGITRWLVNDQPVGFQDEYESNLGLLASGKWEIWRSADGADSFGIPYPFFVLLLTATAAGIFLNKTVWGRYMLALGNNEQAARYSGVNTDRVTVMAYMICTATAAIGGVLFALDSNSVAPSSFGSFFELYAIAAAVLGGCSLRGGEGGIIGVVIGTALMQTLYTLIVLLKISDTLEFAIIGAVILLGVIADELVKRLAAKRRAIRQKQQAVDST